MIRALCVHVDAGDVSTGVDGERSRALALACACDSCVKGGYVAAYIAQKAMRNAARVGIVASDLSARIDAEGIGSLVSARTRARNIEVCRRTIGGADEAVIDGVCVYVSSVRITAVASLC